MLHRCDQTPMVSHGGHWISAANAQLHQPAFTGIGRAAAGAGCESKQVL
jgi:hypothetical protein